ncbi:MAG: 4-(cytidine 5'-diphospho)-2-C-methyl-D-erythritol kinase [Psychromonas sp.]|nr:4-(cytidine 5'-diphospho)-2-C-methyl-D-erythritol kinase [Psychromonas sp.]
MINQTIRWPAPAKLNLFLYVNGQRSDGYHNLQTLFQFIDCCDHLSISSNKTNKISISPSIEGLANHDNLIYKAAMLLKPFAQKNAGADIHLEKNIPMGAGLGGGSSDAATTLVALNYHWKLGLDNKSLAEIGLQLSADIPIFVYGKSAIGEGIGEKLTSATPVENYYVIARPSYQISSASIFNNKYLIRNTKKRSHQELMQHKWQNDCENCVKKKYSEVAKIIDWLIEYAPTRLTGTGACVFSTFTTAEQAINIFDKAPTWLNAFNTHGLNNSPLNKLLSTLQSR